MLVLFSFLAIFSWFFSAQATLVNVTIDDTKGDALTGALVAYAPLNAWNDRANCNNSCPIQPDETMLNDQTWHGSTFSANSSPHANVPRIASVSFNGSAVYVFCALDGDIDAIFYLDGVQVGTLLRTAVEPAGYEYNVPVYANPAIPQGQHTLVVQNGRPNGIQSLMILDSIVYTYDNDSSAASQVDGPVAASSSSSSTKHGPSGTTLAVIGVLVFAIVLLLAILAFVLYRRRRRRRAIYARYMPQGAVNAFPVSIAPSRIHSPALSPVPPAYAGAGGNGGNWWAGRDQKSRDGPRPAHRPYADLDPSQAGLQRPQRWERAA